MRYLLPLCLAVAAATAGRAQTDSTLVVELTGLISDEGYVMVALYDEADAWMDEPHAHYTRREPAQEGRVRVTFAHLAPGRYAIAAFHDENGNGELDTGLFGIPSEPYGFGNDASSMFSAPGFQAASIRFERRAKATIALR